MYKKICLLISLLVITFAQGCGNSKYKEQDSSARSDSILTWYESNAKIIMPTELLDTTRVHELLGKPENSGFVLTSYRGVFALVKPVKWDDKSRIEDGIAYELTDKQYITVRKERICIELSKMDKNKHNNSGFDNFLRENLIKELSSLRDSTMRESKTIIYIQDTKGGGGFVMTRSHN